MGLEGILPEGKAEGCSFCIDYTNKRMGETNKFVCEKGYFDYKEEGEKVEGRRPEKGDPKGVGRNMPCEGKDFRLDAARFNEYRMR